MSLGITAAGWAAIGTTAVGLYSANKQAGAAQDAASTQAAAAQAGIDAQNARFAEVQKILAPFVNAGTGALTAQGNLIGLNGAPAQQTAINDLKSSPMFTTALQTGNQNILANASATGGLRGGNTQAALSQFAPQLLSQMINDQYSRLGGITSLGQNAAAGVGNAGMTNGTNVANLLQEQGAATAGGQIAGGQAGTGYMNAIMQGLGMFKGTGGNFWADTGNGAGVVSGGNGLKLPGGF